MSCEKGTYANIAFSALCSNCTAGYYASGTGTINCEVRNAKSARRNVEEIINSLANFSTLIRRNALRVRQLGCEVKLLALTVLLVVTSYSPEAMKRVLRVLPDFLQNSLVPQRAFRALAGSTRTEHAPGASTALKGR